MAHFPKPFFRPKKNRWYVQLDGKQVNLGPDQAVAFRRYHQIMGDRRQAVPVLSAPSNPKLVVVLDAFLEWCLQHREKRTFDTYKERIQDFLKVLDDKTLIATDLRPYHLQHWVDSHPNWNPGMKRGRLQAVQRALNWAVKQGLLDKSPIAYMEKPPPGKRETVIDYPTYQRMRDLTATQEFRDLIDVCWETGCRPQEIWRIEKRHLDAAGKRWVFPVHESKGKKKIRIVYLTDTTLEICQRLALKHPTGPLFRNSDGRPWNRHATSCVFLRMKKHLGKKYALVDFRHSFCTRSLKSGVDPITLSFLLGHADTSMLAKTYAHLGHESGHLQNALAKVNPLRPADVSA
jgi:integrase